jgi:hypothetical protein
MDAGLTRPGGNPLPPALADGNELPPGMPGVGRRYGKQTQNALLGQHQLPEGQVIRCDPLGHVFEADTFEDRAEVPTTAARMNMRTAIFLRMRDPPRSFADVERLSLPLCRPIDKRRAAVV